MDKLIFSETPVVTFASNKFIEVPTILQYENTPLIQVVKAGKAEYTTLIPIYHSDGTYLAKVVGSRLFTTPEGKKAGLSLEYPHRMTVCKLGDRVLFEIIRQEAAALKTRAELYTPDGVFVKVSDSPKPELYDALGSALQVSGVFLSGDTFRGSRIGVWIRKDGSVGIGVS
ncbi:MAG: hypothetical protein WBE11_13555 [Candidatus Aminicenantaceae bacterium]